MLDLWVAKAEELNAYAHGDYCFLRADSRDWIGNASGKYSPSTDWSQGGPIIEREGISLLRVIDSREHIGTLMYAAFSQDNHDKQFRHKSALIAAMRCYVGSKFGEEVEDE